MDYGKAFTFITQDDEWIVKIGIGALFAILVPVGGIGVLFLLGWSLEIARRVIRGETEPLPDWTNIGGFFLNGLKMVGVFVIWSLPFAVVVGLVSVVSTFMQNQAGSSDAAGIAVVILSLCVFLIAFVFGVVLAVLVVGAFGTLAETGSFKAAVNPVNAFRVLKANVLTVVLAGIVGSLVNSLLPSLGSIACLIGAFPAMAYSFAVIGHLFGQAYAEAMPGHGQPGAIAESADL